MTYWPVRVLVCLTTLPMAILFVISAATGWAEVYASLKEFFRWER